MAPRAWITVAVLTSAFLSTPARAQDAESSTERRWYGWQIALTDAALVGLAVAHLDGDSSEISIASGIGLIASGPVIHGLHGQRAEAAGSAVARIVLPGLGFLVGTSLGRGEHEDGDGFTWAEGGVGGMAVGWAMALGLDLVLARETVEVVEQPPAAPMVIVGASSATVGLTGSF